MTPIIFLDIDGVLLSGRAWLLPQNAAVREMRQIPHHSPADAPKRVTFDACAVAMVNRLCSMTGAKLVSHSNWRHTIGPQETLAKLIEQGIAAEHFHADAVCDRYNVAPDKARDIREWCADHLLTPVPDAPDFFDDDASFTDRSARNGAWDSARHDSGLDILIIDDEVISRPPLAVPQIKTDFADGFTAAMYRVAITYFAAADLEFGVLPVSSEDMKRVVDAFGGDRVAAATWLQTNTEFGYAHATELNAERLRKMAEGDRHIRDVDAWVSGRREAVWHQLATRTRPLDDDFDDEPSVSVP